MDTALEQSQSGNAQFAPQPRQVHTITDRFSMANTYLINDDRMIIVDPGSELNARLTIEYIPRFLHRSLDEVDLIVLTHLHPDHTAGIEALRRQCQTPVAASAVAREIAEGEAPAGHYPSRGSGFARRVPPPRHFAPTLCQPGQADRYLAQRCRGLARPPQLAHYRQPRSHARKPLPLQSLHPRTPLRRYRHHH